MARRHRHKNRANPSRSNVIDNQPSLNAHVQRPSTSGEVAKELRLSMMTSLLIVLVLAAAASLNEYYHWTGLLGNLLYDLLNIR